MTKLNEKYFCYLTVRATETVKTMVDAGFDEDLAIGVLETLWQEEEVYELPPIDKKERDL